MDIEVIPGSSDSKASAYNAGDPGSIPGSGRSPGEGNGNSLKYSYLGNPMDTGAWWPTVHGVAKSRTRLSDFFFSFCLMKQTLDLKQPSYWGFQWREIFLHLSLMSNFCYIHLVSQLLREIYVWLICLLFLLQVLFPYLQLK